MNGNMTGFELPNWGSPSSFNFGPQPMNIPAFDAGAGSLGTSDFATADMTGGIPSTGGYQPLEFGMNIPSFQLGLSGLSTLGNLWGGYQSTKLAKDAFKFSKGMAEKNYANQIKSYNTALEDKATSRGFVQGNTAEETQQYIDKNKL